MPTPPTAHHEHSSWIPSVIELFGSCSHANGTASEMGGHTGSNHDDAHPAGECLRADCMMAAVLTAGKGAPHTVPVLESGAGGAGEVGLDRNNSTDLLLNIWMHSKLH